MVVEKMSENKDTPKKKSLLDIVGILAPIQEKVEESSTGETFMQIREEALTKYFQDRYPVPKSINESNNKEGMPIISKEFSEFLLSNKSKIKKTPTNTIKYIITNDVSLATHWRTYDETVAGTDITLGKVYPILYHRHEQEEVIVGLFSTQRRIPYSELKNLYSHLIQAVGLHFINQTDKTSHS